MKTLLRLLLKSQHQQNRSRPAQTEKGMTLIELLIGTVMAFLIITPMLGFVVDMLNTDRREQVKSNTEQDIQAAVDFIAQDLSQAIYIYDNNDTIGATATGIPAIRGFLPNPQNQTPILVFWKRQQLRNSLPVNTDTPQPSDCIPNTLTGKGACNDTYVLSLVAYYQVSNDTDPTWCQPLGGAGVTCPTRIVRYQIQDGLKNPAESANANPAARYFTVAQLGTRSGGLRPSDAFNIGAVGRPGFDISNPTVNVTASQNWGNGDVLVNYLDHNASNTPGLALTGNECTTALGNPTIQDGAATVAILENRLNIVGATNSFYACVDTQKNLARVTIRGNSLRRLQTNDTDFKTSRSAFFPTASVQVQGLGARGK